MTVTTTPVIALTDGTALTLIGRITAVDVRINRQENREATITLATAGGTVNVLVPPRTYAAHQNLLHEGRLVAVDVGVGKWRGETTAMAFGIQAHPRRHPEHGMNQCKNCGAPGGYPYCSDGCRHADQCTGNGCPDCE